MAYEFHYTPTGTGVISGKEVLEQTEDAINDLGNTAISGVQEALDKAEQALTNSANAVDDAQTALNTANNAEGVAIQAQTDVSNLSGTVTNIGNRVTTAEGNITNLQGRMTTAEGKITNIQGRMTTAESDIGNLQTAVSTAQATANSAQQTATTARQQSYVLRYSSSSVTDNSTIAYSTLDNTDNIKSGDKVIDVDGKIFSVVSVDTANQTVTVGSALIDLALDSNVVHTTGDETISGDKVFNNRLIKNIDVVLGTAPSTGKFGNIDIADNNKTSIAQWVCGVYTNGQTYGRLFIQNKTASDGTGLSPTGTLIGCGLNISLPANSTSEGQGSITPRSNKTTDFGLLSYQWRNLWCEKLFLNGTQLDPSAFVTTDTAQTISGTKTFTDNNMIKTSSPKVLLINTSQSGNTAPSSNTASFLRFDGGTVNNFGGVQCEFLTTGENRQTNYVYDITKAKLNSIQQRTNSTTAMTVFNADLLAPVTDGVTALGSSSKRWSDCQTKLINGLTPSSLGMPVDRDSRVDISGYLTNLSSGAVNRYTVLTNGYIYLSLNNVVTVHCNADTDTNLSHYRQTFARASAGQLYCFFPVRKNDIFACQWYTTESQVTLTNAFFIPCQGNV